MSWPTALVLITLILGITAVLVVGLRAAGRQTPKREGLNLAERPIEKLEPKFRPRGES